MSPFVECFDSAGVRLDSSGPNHPYVKGMPNAAFTYSANFGGGYQAGTEDNADLVFSVGADVDYVYLSIYPGGSAEMRIRGFKVFTNQQRRQCDRRPHLDDA